MNSSESEQSKQQSRALIYAVAAVPGTPPSSASGVAYVNDNNHKHRKNFAAAAASAADDATSISITAASHYGASYNMLATELSESIMNVSNFLHAAYIFEWGSDTTEHLLSQHNILVSTISRRCLHVRCGKKGDTERRKDTRLACRCRCFPDTSLCVCYACRCRP